MQSSTLPTNNNNHPTNNHDTTQDSGASRGPADGYHPVIHEAACLIATGWSAVWALRQSRDESPPESIYAIALTTLLWDEIQSERVEVAYQYVIHTGTGSSECRVADIQIHQRSTAVRGLVEISSYRHHAATEAAWTADVRRLRELQAAGYDVLTYTSREVAANPWRVAVDTIAHITRAWRGFEAIIIPPGVRQMAEACAAAMSPPLPIDLRSASADGGTAAVDWAAAGRLIASLPSVPPRDAREARTRRRYPRAYEVWTDTELKLLRRAHADGLAMWRLVEVFGRTPGAIRRGLQRLGLEPSSASC
jgi:hypothetical protein